MDLPHHLTIRTTRLRQAQFALVAGDHARRNKKVVWECRCECGNLVLLTINQLRHYKSCGCNHRKLGEENHRWKGHGGIPGSFWAAFRSSARRRGITIGISIEEAWTIFLRQDRKCALSDVQLDFAIPYKGGNTTASLDRIDSSKGYCPGNVQWVHKIINLMKWNLTTKRFVYFCGLVANPLRSETLPARPQLPCCSQ
jgi:hypothetical protein